MAVQDYGLTRWWIHKGRRNWLLFHPDCLVPHSIFNTFAEAHAAYLDAVTCPFDKGWSGKRCNRKRGHDGWHTVSWR